MSKRAAKMLFEDMEYMGPVRLMDVEEAQRRIVEVIRHLEDTGEIIVPKSSKDEIVG
jgi:flagellar motor switch protein FliG